MASLVNSMAAGRSMERQQQMVSSSNVTQSASNYYGVQSFAEQHFVNAQRQLCDASGRLWGYYDANGQFSPQYVDGQTGQIVVNAQFSGRQMVLQGSVQTAGTSTTTTGGMITTNAAYAQSMQQNQRYISGVSETSNVIGREFGQERIISVSQRVDEGKMQIVSERFIEHEIRVPKRITREEIIEKVVVMPERIIQEEIIEDIAIVKERIVEVARPMIIEKVVEIPEIEYVEKIVEYAEIITQERLKHVDKVEVQERLREVEKIIPQERIVEVPFVQYREIPVDVVREVPEWRDEIVLKEVPVPQYVDKPIEQIVQVEVAIDIERSIPVPVEANVVYEFKLPRIKPRYHKITYPVYLPRFIEIPVAMELLQSNSGLMQQTEMYLQQVGMLTKSAASLCEIENLATTIMKADIHSYVSSQDMQNVVLQAWKQGTLTGASASVVNTSMVHSQSHSQSQSHIGMGVPSHQPMIMSHNSPVMTRI